MYLIWKQILWESQNYHQTENPPTHFVENIDLLKIVSDSVKGAPTAKFFLLEFLGLISHSKDAFLVGEYDARKCFSKFGQRRLGLTVLKFRKFEFRKYKSKWV